jgi:hypothetical protein
MEKIPTEMNRINFNNHIKNGNININKKNQVGYIQQGGILDLSCVDGNSFDILLSANLKIREA